MKQHVSQVARICYYQLLRQIRRCHDISMQLVSALVLSELDYCNAMLTGLSQSTLATWQRVQNAAARLVLVLRPHDHVSQAQLWLATD